jgi:glycosyltransferase involved in cell wall biosynthesis
MISIIIPTLNEEEVIEKILKNIASYSGEKEIIVSDGKSIDKTLEIARKYADQVVVHDKLVRQTIGGGRNAGAAMAHGEYLLFLDADIHVPDIDKFLEKALAIFEHNKKLAGLTVYLNVFPEMASWADVAVHWYFNRLVYTYNNILHYGASSGDFQMVRTDAFRAARGFDERLAAGEDFDMFARLSRKGQTRSIPYLTAYHTGRRAHKVGWPKLLFSWFMNWLYAVLLKKSWDKEWKVIR